MTHEKEPTIDDLIGYCLVMLNIKKEGSEERMEQNKENLESAWLNGSEHILYYSQYHLRLVEIKRLADLLTEAIKDYLYARKHGGNRTADGLLKGLDRLMVQHFRGYLWVRNEEESDETKKYCNAKVTWHKARVEAWQELWTDQAAQVDANIRPFVIQMKKLEEKEVRMAA